MSAFSDYFQSSQTGNEEQTLHEIHSCPELIECIQQVGFLPLLESGIRGYSAEALMAEECRYTVFPDGGWEWPLWQWKGPVVTEGGYVYGKFFNGKAGFITRQWWPHFCNYRRSLHPLPAEDSIEGTILAVLQVNGSMITRDLRRACGFDGPKMRGKFDSYVTRLQAACRIVTEDFVYPRDKHDRPYGWGWALLNTPEHLLGAHALLPSCTPLESRRLILDHLHTILPQASDKQLEKILG